MPTHKHTNVRRPLIGTAGRSRVRCHGRPPSFSTPSTTQVRVSWVLIPRARAGDTEEVDCQRAEAHLRLLAEEELRRPAWAWGERRIRVGRIAQLLTALGALDDEVAGRILADFDLALLARQADAPGRRSVAAVAWRRSAAVRFRPAMPVSSRPASGPVSGRLIGLGQVIPLRGEPAGGEVYLLSYAQTEPGPQLSLFKPRSGHHHRAIGRSPRQAPAALGVRASPEGGLSRDS
jgi:hypothetical protein